MRIKHIASSTILLAILISNHTTAMENTYREFPVSSEHPYKYNPTLYEITFRHVLVYRLATFKAEGKSTFYLKDHETGLLASMEEQKNNIFERSIRKIYYPQVKTLEWKK